MKVKKADESSRKEINDSNAAGVKFYPMITAGDGAPNFALRLFDISRDGHTPYHTHDWEHEVYIIEGDGYIVGDNKKIKVEKADFIFVEPNEIHQFLAGQSGLKMLCIVPNKGQPK